VHSIFEVPSPKSQNSNNHGSKIEHTLAQFVWHEFAVFGPPPLGMSYILAAASFQKTFLSLARLPCVQI
jgi:hypothetical protein